MNPEKWRALLLLEEREDPCVYPSMDPASKIFWQNQILKLMPPQKYTKILDIGCGCGAEVKALNELGYDAVGISCSQADVDYAKAHYELTILKMDMHDLQFSPNYFDGAVSRQSLEHAYSVLLVMMEVRTVLKLGGRWFIDLPSPHNKDMWGHNHRSILYPTQMRFYFQLCGFDIIDFAESSNQTLGYNGGGDPYRYLVEKGDISKSSHQQVLEKLEQVHRHAIC